MQDMYIEIAARLKDLREIMDYSIEEMAKLTDVTPEEYQVLESGNSDLVLPSSIKQRKHCGLTLQIWLPVSLPGFLLSPW